MASVVRLCIVFFLFTTIYLSCTDAAYKKYVSLVSDIHKYYKTSSVFFIFSKNNPRMQEYTMVHLLSRIFSKKCVVTLIMNFAKLDERLNSYRKQIGRPLVVVLVKSVSDIVEFNESTRNMNKSYPIWLVIFYADPNSPFCEYCTNPIGNMFDLRFDTLMLVICCDKSTLKEWWSVHENQTEINDFGIWTVNKRLKLLAIDGLNARRHNVEGTGLRVVIVSNSSFVHDYGYRIGGIFGEVLRELKHAMNFTITAIVRVQGFGGYNSTAKRWSGAVNLLVRGEADIAIADFTMTNSRLDVIDFTYPLVVSRSHLFIKKPDGSGVQWSAYFQAFTWKIWGIIIVLLITTPLLLVIIKVRKDSISLLSLGIDNYLSVWGIFCQQGLFEFPTETPLRIAYFSLYISALVISAAYSASLISFLTLSSPSLPFSTLDGFANDGSYKLIVYQNSSDYDLFISSNESIFIKMTELMKPWKDLPPNTKKGWEQVCKERVALYTNYVEKKTMDIPCEVTEINTGRVDSLAMALPAGSQYTNVVNYHIQRFMANGIFNRLKEVYYTKDVPPDTSYDVVEFSGIAPLLSILAGGIVLAFVVLLCENTYCTLKNHGRFWQRNTKLRKTKLHGWINYGRRDESLSKNLQKPLKSRTGKFHRSFVGYYP